MKFSFLLPIALFFAAAHAGHPEPEPVECSGVGSITAAADENGDYYEICTCPEGTERALLYTLSKVYLRVRMRVHSVAPCRTAASD
ncbi:uncharacterized protein ANIA_11322 [Aspergillus nidulans FGSC A4]|uniref:Uncharacterized protein n=1 Tax=Emericella nidulans (strain FGSC A4 / ATCC 38163 / CBS 112.46 / NRRL 194 / M139) TaxID=227321 RepID=C8VLF7_EMENI|nr:hypothetical protein [Aspergillus nidulans FGSC A4]CBF86041.1 TPA: hypothetical protein ANIA_11322 [Aspergillus nidulans FGSC A4]